MDARPVLLHYHIYKNAGTTVEAVLEREFGVFFSTLHTPGANALVMNSEIVAFLEEHETVSALSSHQFRYPRPAAAGFEFFDICFVRHPLDRLFSQYSFLRKPGVSDALVEEAKAMDLAAFLSFLLRQHPEYASNAQTALLLHQGDRSSLSAEDARAAGSLVREISIIGTVEQFDESLMLAEYTLQPWFPDLRLHYAPQNVTNSQTMSFDERLAFIRARCGETLWRQLLDANALDVALWNEASAELRRRVEARPDHEHWLREFRSRVDIYTGAPRLRDKLLQRLHVPFQKPVRVQR
ncbi:MAG TPA: sulfotransferase family 2 domain-containing protein [Bryobacteraceae bacterium]|nr:sulfotransferase family 2 domain-containing protein [Bryobacteraceae bacterium]